MTTGDFPILQWTVGIRCMCIFDVLDFILLMKRINAKCHSLVVFRLLAALTKCRETGFCS